MLKPSKSCSAPIYSLKSNYQISKLHTHTHSYSYSLIVLLLLHVRPCDLLKCGWGIYGWKAKECVSVRFLAGIITRCLGMATAAAEGHKRRKTKIRERNREWMMEWVFGETSLKRVTGSASREDRTVLKQRRKCVTQGRVSVCVCVCVCVCVFE